MLLAGDVGGTKTLLGLFDRAEPRPRPRLSREYATNTFDSFSSLLRAFVGDVPHLLSVDAAAVGVAGPVVGDHGALTNIAWDISRSEIADCLGTPRVRLLNDLEALATSVAVLTPDETAVLQDGTAHPDGNAVVIAAGTGLGQAYLHRLDGRLRPMASEGGHADFAARTDREIELVRMLRHEHGRVEVEHVVSGPGLLNLYRLTHGGGTCAAVRGIGDQVEAPAAVSQAALQGTCDACTEALTMFVSAYGAEAGNLALRGVATAGVFIGGGIAPKILPALQDGRFAQAFRAKSAMSSLVSAMPVRVILNPEAGLLGAAVAAQELAALP